MGAGRYTFVTVVFEHEYDLAKFAARSFCLYCDREMVESIILIDNSHWRLSERKRAALSREYGELAARVRWIGADDLAHMPRWGGWLR
jgi:hypothetical protein